MVETIGLSGLSSYTLGRNLDVVEIPLEHASCSRQHAKIERDGAGSVFVTDLGSAQGTYLDGAREPLPPKERTRLAEGSALCFGKSTRTFVLRGAGGAKAPSTLSTDDKRKRLWGGPKRERPGASEAARDRESSNVRKWGAAAESLGDAARSDKFLALMGAKKHAQGPPAAAGGGAKRKQDEVFDRLEADFDSARRHGPGRRGLG